MLSLDLCSSLLSGITHLRPKRNVDRTLDSTQFNNRMLHDTKDCYAIKVKSILQTGDVPFAGPVEGQNQSCCLGSLFCKETSSQQAPCRQEHWKGRETPYRGRLLGRKAATLLRDWLPKPGEKAQRSGNGYGLLTGLRVTIGKGERPWRSYENSIFKSRPFRLDKRKLSDAPRGSTSRHQENSGSTTQPRATEVMVIFGSFRSTTASSKLMARSTSTTFSHWVDLYATSTCSAGQMWVILEV